jgi:hypothetical protein
MVGALEPVQQQISMGLQMSSRQILIMRRVCRDGKSYDMMITSTINKSLNLGAVMVQHA